MRYNCKFLICLCLLQHIKYLNIQVPEECECYYAPFLPLFLIDANEAFLSSPPSPPSSALISLSSFLSFFMPPLSCASSST